jgi:lipopolysaccharide export LptBFGC system permease protein LptF
MGILTYIRQKTDKQKKIFSLVLAGALTFVIVISYFSLVGSPISSNQEVVAESDKLSSVKPLQMIKEEFSNIFSETDSLGSSSLPLEIVDATSTEMQNVNIKN